MNQKPNRDIFLVILGLLTILASLVAVVEGGHRDHKLLKTGLILVGVLSIQLGRRGLAFRKKSV